MPSQNKDEKYDAGDRGQFRQKKDRAKLKRENEIEQMRKVLDTYEGRSVLWRILEQAGIYRQSFTGNSETFFREGQRKVGLELLAEIEAASPRAYSKMRDEEVERKEGRKL